MEGRSGSFHFGSKAGRLLVLALAAIVSCTPPPEPKDTTKNISQQSAPTVSSPRVEKKSSNVKKVVRPKEQVFAPTEQAKAAIDSAPKLPLLTRDEQLSARAQMDASANAEAAAKAIAEKETEARINQELEIKKTEPAKVAPEVHSSSSSLPVPVTIVTQSSSSSLAKAEPENAFGHPTPKLPLSEEARLEAGKSLLTNEIVTRKPDRVNKPAVVDEHARARLGDKSTTDEKKMAISSTPFLLEALFISIVLICLVGAMWYRLTHDFGGPRRRRDK